MSPIQQITIPASAWPMWKALQIKPVEMTERCTEVEGPAIDLINLGLAVFERGALRLLSDCAPPDDEDKLS